MSNLQVPDPGLLAKLELYLTDQTNWHTGVMLDLKIVCTDGIFYWSSLLLASLSPLMSSLLNDQDDERVLMLPDSNIETPRSLLKKLLRPSNCFLNKSEKQLLCLWGVNRNFWRTKSEEKKNFVQIVGVGSGASTSNIREFIEASENEVDIIWKDDRAADINKMDEERNIQHAAADQINFDNSVTFDDASNEVCDINIDDFYVKESIKVKKSGTGRKMFCKLCSVSFQSRPYADYQDHINSHKNAQGMYACNQPNCGRVFRAWCHLSDHVYSHGNHMA